MRKSAVFLFLSCAAAWCQSEAVVEIDAGKVLHSIPRTIYGTFLEPIGHSTYGGLWAQILENPSFICLKSSGVFGIVFSKSR